MRWMQRFFRYLQSRPHVVRPRQRKSRLHFEKLEDRLTPSAAPIVGSPIDGVGNNVANPTWGSAGVDFLRLAEPDYADGVSAPGGVDRPSAREISNVIADQGDADIISDRNLSAMIYAWGQFLDHDLDLTRSGTQSFNIPVPTGDPSFDPNGTGTQVIPLKRSAGDPATGTGVDNPLQQINNVTAWLDGSQIYGSDAATADSLRSHVRGLLKTSTGNLLPTDANGNFLAGDIRVNENIELTAMQTLWMREHNRIAMELGLANPKWTDERIYQAARARVIGELQVITYKEWLPTLLGPNALSKYTGYDPTVNPGISNEFATASFRVGHSMLGDDVEFLGNDGRPIADEVSLAEAFFNPDLVRQNGIDSILKYLSSDPASEIDTTVVGSVRNFLFGQPGAGGLDLASLNIQRGRDHGIADYNSMREAFGLARVTRFDQITSKPDVQAKLEQLYGTVDNIDAWVGGLAEDHVAGGSTGPLIRAVLVDQFERLRDGDRFWYQNVFHGKDLKAIEGTTLADVVRRNTTNTNLQGNVFTFKVEVSGTVFDDRNRDGKQQGNEKGRPGQVVELVNSDTGEVVASVLTDASGRYRFTVADGLGLGTV